jgi:predicted DNA binding CopG/RHH family protein
MSPRVPDEGAAREIVRTVRLGPTDDAALARRRSERGMSVSTYLRALIREDAAEHPEARRGNARTDS